MDIYSIGVDQYPPSYDSVIEYDNMLLAPPPPYECIVVLDPVAVSSSAQQSETKKYPVTVQIVDERSVTNYI